MARTIPKPEEWPVEDRNVWATLTRPGGPLDDRGAFSHYSKATLRMQETAYGKWLSWLSETHPDVIF